MPDSGERRITCASCGKQVAPGARYCVHCGAEQSVPTPIAAVAAALMARERPREAANAAHAEPVHPAPERVLAPARAPEPAPTVPPPGARGAVANGGSEEPTRPAYADAPRRRGLAVAFIAGCVVVAIAVAGVIVWRVQGERPEASAGNAAISSPPAAEPPSSSASAPSPSAAPAETPVRAEPSPGGGEPAVTPPSVAAGNAETAPAVSAPVEIKPLPPHASPPRAPRHAAAPATTSRAPAPPPPPEPAARPAPAPAPPPVAKAAPAEPTAPRVADRWARLDEELSRCTREDFIARVICGQRVRFRYCDGYWGKVPQCPGNPAPERGQ